MVKAVFVFIGMLIGGAVLKCLRGCYKCCKLRVKGIDQSIYDDSFTLNLGVQAFKTITRDNYRDLICPTKVGDQAPEVSLFTIDGISKRLFDFQVKGRPLVINFGSLT